MVWHHKTFWPPQISREAAESKFDEDRGDNRGVDGHLPILAHQHQVRESRGFRKLPQGLGKKFCLVHFLTPHLK